MKIVVNVVAFLAALVSFLYIIGTKMAYEEIKRKFRCPRCGTHFDKLETHCNKCGKEMRKWGGIYRTLFRIKFSCLDKDGLCDYNKAKWCVYKDRIMLTIILVISLFLIYYVNR